MYGSLSHPATFPFPTILRPVLGAWTKNVVFAGEDNKLEAAYISMAKDLVREGAGAIKSNCGFTLKFQRAMTEALSVPVSMPSLLLLPYLIASIKGRVGTLTFASRPLTSDLLELTASRRKSA